MASQYKTSAANHIWRKASDHAATALAILSTVVVIAPLIAIFAYLLYKGASSLNVNFFTKVPAPVGETGGGMANAIVGSGVLLAIGSLLGVPVGIAAGIFLAEFGRGGKLGNLVRFTADVLNGVPSIVMGISVYALIVLPQKHFSAFSGGVALGIMMIPTITRTTEEMLLMVPNSIREAALGLGVPNWRSVLSITLRTASPGVITGCMLAFARVAGETARCSLPPLATSSGAPASTSRSRHFRCRSMCMRSPPTTNGIAWPGPARWLAGIFSPMSSSVWFVAYHALSFSTSIPTPTNLPLSRRHDWLHSEPARQQARSK